MLKTFNHCRILGNGGSRIIPWISSGLPPSISSGIVLDFLPEIALKISPSITPEIPSVTKLGIPPRIVPENPQRIYIEKNPLYHKLHQIFHQEFSQHVHKGLL